MYAERLQSVWDTLGQRETMKKIELKPCPFCGGKAKRIRMSNKPFPPFVRVQCRICGCGTTFLRKDSKDAVEIWNRRAI